MSNHTYHQPSSPASWLVVQSAWHRRTVIEEKETVAAEEEGGEG